MHAALNALNTLVESGVIPGYAVGGAIGASFYIEAQATEDLDIFVVLPETSGGLLSLTPIYIACTALGGVIEHEHIRFGPWPVQILPAYKPLVEEALAEALVVDFDGIPTRVLTAEHLCAIALDTARLKDFLRVGLFIEQDAVDLVSLESLLKRYNLLDRRAKVPNWPKDQDHVENPGLA